jgi:hypothetical protein
MSGFSERFLAGAVIVTALCTGFTQAGCDSDDSTTPAGLIAVWQLQEFILDDGTTTPVDDPAKYTIDPAPFSSSSPVPSARCRTSRSPGGRSFSTMKGES